MNGFFFFFNAGTQSLAVGKCVFIYSGGALVCYYRTLVVPEIYSLNTGRIAEMRQRREILFFCDHTWHVEQ